MVEPAPIAEPTPEADAAPTVEPTPLVEPTPPPPPGAPTEPPPPAVETGLPTSGGTSQAGEAGAGSPGSPLSSVTLAELYFQQGLLERAVEVYRQVLEEEPANSRARARLDEVQALVSASATDLPVPPSGSSGDDREIRRQALVRTIELLEGLLAVVRRR